MERPKPAEHFDPQAQEHSQQEKQERQQEQAKVKQESEVRLNRWAGARQRMIASLHIKDRDITDKIQNAINESNKGNDEPLAQVRKELVTRVQREHRFPENKTAENLLKYSYIEHVLPGSMTLRDDGPRGITSVMFPAAAGRAPATFADISKTGKTVYVEDKTNLASVDFTPGSKNAMNAAFFAEMTIESIRTQNIATFTPNEIVMAYASGVESVNLRLRRATQDRFDVSGRPSVSQNEDDCDSDIDKQLSRWWPAHSSCTVYIVRTKLERKSIKDGDHFRLLQAGELAGTDACSDDLSLYPIYVEVKPGLPAAVLTPTARNSLNERCIAGQLRIERIKDDLVLKIPDEIEMSHGTPTTRLRRATAATFRPSGSACSDADGWENCTVFIVLSPQFPRN